MKGRVKWWCTDRGYGFIEYENEENIFVHLDNEDIKVYHIDENQEIEFTIEESDNSVYLKDLKLLTE